MISSHLMLTGIAHVRTDWNAWEGYRRTGWNLLTVTRGRVRLSCGGKKSVTEQGTFYLIDPEPRRFFEPLGDAEIEWMHFDPCACSGAEKAWPELLPGIFFCTPPPDGGDRMLADLREIRKLELERRPGWFSLASHLTAGLLLRGNLFTGKNRENPALDEIKALLCSGKISIENAASACGMSRAVFFRKFRAAFDVTPGECRRSFLLMRARTMLENTLLSVSEIADELQMPNVQYLSARFKKHYGLTPCEFRNYTRKQSTHSV